MSARLALVATLVLAAPQALAQDSAPWLTRAAGDALDHLEAFLLEAPFARFDFEARSDSVFIADLRGAMWLGPDGSARLEADGTFGEARIDHTFISDGRRMVVDTDPERALDSEAGRETREALVLGMTRMGLLHNLARLSAGRPPDHADEGVAEWVTTTNTRWIEDGRALAFSIRVAGNEVAEATLWLDPDTGLPVLRSQTIRFPGGRMNVEERYAHWSLEPAAEGAFAIE